MKILVIEDEAAAAQGILEDVSGLGYDIGCQVVTSRDDAVAMLDSEEFDLLLCDLLMPAQSGSLDQSIQHGLMVYEHARAVSPGTPAVFLTGHGDFRDVRQQLPDRAPEDLFGTGATIRMVDLFFKDERAKYLGYIEGLARGLDGLNQDIEVEVASARSPLAETEERLLRIYARTIGAAKVVAEELSGLSGMRPLRLHMLDSQGAHLAWVFGKLGQSADVQGERQSVQTIAPRLRVGTYAPLVRVIQAGAGKRGGLFYNLVDDFPHPALEWLAEDLSRSRGFVGRIRAIVDDWQKSKTVKIRVIEDLRRADITDEDLAPFAAELEATSWKQVEKGSIEVTETVQHGDLHGFNILVREDGQPLLIDFGRAGTSSCCLDSIVLEFSVLFHEDSPFKEGTWPTLDQCESWDDLSAFVVDSPVAELIRDVRSWGLEVSPSEALFYVTGYCQALRQLKYPDTNKQRALAIARAGVGRLLKLV